MEKRDWWTKKHAKIYFYHNQNPKEETKVKALKPDPAADISATKGPSRFTLKQKLHIKVTVQIQKGAYKL